MYWYFLKQVQKVQAIYKTGRGGRGTMRRRRVIRLCHGGEGGGEKARRSKKFFLFSANFIYPFVILRPEEGSAVTFARCRRRVSPSPIFFEGGKEMVWQEYGKSCFFLKRALGKRWKTKLVFWSVFWPPRKFARLFEVAFFFSSRMSRPTGQQRVRLPRSRLPSRLHQNLKRKKHKKEKKEEIIFAGLTLCVNIK